MNDQQRLRAARLVHTSIYVVMTVGILAILWAGVTGRRGPWLWLALGLLSVETLVFTTSGMRCPLTATVRRYSDGAPVSDTYFPERFTRHTLEIFGPLLGLGVALVATRLLLGEWSS